MSSTAREATRSSSAGSARRTASRARSRSSRAPTSRSDASPTGGAGHPHPAGHRAARPAPADHPDRAAHPLAPVPAARHVRRRRRPHRRRGAARARRSSSTSTRPTCPRTPRSSTTTSSSGSRCPPPTATRWARSPTSIHGAGQDLLAVRTADGREVLVPFVSALVPVVDVRRRPRSRSPTGPACSPRCRTRTETCASTSSRSSPSTSRRCGSRWPARRRTPALLDVRVHDLRDWTHDRHRTVDDTPYGGGAGMVMKPEPWGEALDALVPAPAGEHRAGRAHPER